MTRIIAGHYGGRRISVPKSGTRPTTDRVREALFSSLSSRIKDFSELVVLDLFAGSGALGLEAISRGAREAVFVDSAAIAVATVKVNLKDLGITAKVLRQTALAFSLKPSHRFGLVLIDPPYDLGVESIRQILLNLAAHQGLCSDALIVVEGPKKSAFSWPEGFDAVDERSYGETHLWYGHFHG